MKIKTWLLVTFFVVMILPVGATYGLYMWINAYYHDKSVEEYITKWTELNAIKKVLNDPVLYEVGADARKVAELTNDQLGITLYTKAGYTLYSSNPLAPNFITKDTLYTELFHLKQRYNAFTYKEPVYQNSAVIGIYEINLVRDEWVSGVEKRSWLVGGGLIVFFITTFCSVLWLVNRKLNRPLQELMKQMHLFAKGEKTLSHLHERKDEIGELAATFQTMQSEIECARETLKNEQQQKEWMIASISHDLKTPLTSIQAYAESLENNTLTDEEQAEYRTVIVAKSKYMKLMIEDLLMYTLLNSANYDIELTPVEGAEFFDMLVSDYGPLCAERGYSLQVNCKVDGEYAVNPKQFMRVVDNLMANAWTYSEAGGTIGLAAVNVQDVPSWCFDFVKNGFK
ncbi:MAG: HAMP domain-containing sensor histidine kinase, partial [Lysinibacillus sp.]